jgi:hypothetical protein
MVVFGGNRELRYLRVTRIRREGRQRMAKRKRIQDKAAVARFPLIPCGMCKGEGELLHVTRKPLSCVICSGKGQLSEADYLIYKASIVVRRGDTEPTRFLLEHLAANERDLGLTLPAALPL